MNKFLDDCTKSHMRNPNSPALLQAAKQAIQNWYEIFGKHSTHNNLHAQQTKLTKICLLCCLRFTFARINWVVCHNQYKMECCKWRETKVTKYSIYNNMIHLTKWIRHSNSMFFETFPLCSRNQCIECQGENNGLARVKGNARKNKKKEEVRRTLWMEIKRER